MEKIKNVVICILAILVVVLAFIVIKNGKVNDNVDTNPNVNGGENIQTEDLPIEETIKLEEEIIEQVTKQAIINIAKQEYYDNSTQKENVVPAEGHIVWLTRVDENTLYVYVETKYGIYKKDDQKISAVNSKVTHILFTFNIINEEELELVEYDVLKQNEKSQWADLIKEIFTDVALDVIEREPDTSLYQDQIRSYLNNIDNGDN